jgi:hypothetical protein
MEEYPYLYDVGMSMPASTHVISDAENDRRICC